MAVTTKFGAVKGTRGASNPVQTISGVIMNNSTTGGGGITTSFSILEAIALNVNFTSGVRERDSGSSITRARKILSSGVFAYNAAAAGTYVISRIATTLAGVSTNVMLFMAQANKVKSIHEFNHDFGVRMLQAWVNGRFSWTGKLANGNSKASRIMWLNAAGTAVAAPSPLNTFFMRDLRDGNATDKAVDDAATPTRALPGELFFQVDFVNKSLSGGSFFDYKPITGM
jgi:hypothetical protein